MTLDSLGWFLLQSNGSKSLRNMTGNLSCRTIAYGSFRSPKLKNQLANLQGSSSILFDSSDLGVSSICWTWKYLAKLMFEQCPNVWCVLQCDCVDTVQAWASISPAADVLGLELAGWPPFGALGSGVLAMLVGQSDLSVAGDWTH